MLQRFLVLCGCAALLGACSKDKPSSAAPTAPASAVVAVKSHDPDKLLEPGAPAPDFEAIAQTGQAVSLKSLRGKPVVVYFYPKDDTPGCTTEAKSFRDNWVDVKKANAVVLGVSSQDNVSHRAFTSKFELPFLLLPDTDHKIAAAFGVPVHLGFAKRVTFLIDKDGKIAKVWPDVDPDQHAEAVIAAIKALSG